MAGHEWEDWFEREELIGQISDIRVQNLQVERENVQKRTFTRWMNLHLEKCDPPMEVHDLFRDIQDGRILMALLEELSGCKLLHGFKKSSHRIFRLNNIAKVLSFLEERNVKLVSIDASDVADGNSSIVLGLIWNIILFFQIKELTGNIRSQFPSSSSLSSIPTSSDSDTSHCSTPSEERRAPASDGRAIKKLLQWVQKRTRKYGVAVKDFGKSWTSGLAFLAVIKAIDPSLVDMRRSVLRTPRENLEDAFRTAHYSLGIARLLEPEDVTINPPDEQSIMTYVSQFLEHFPGMEEPVEEPSQVIERSVSMGRLSAHDSEADMRRNGVHRSRLKERPYPPPHSDCVPPKIFISALGGDGRRRGGGGRSPASLPSRTRAWASEDSLADPPAPGEDEDSSSSAGLVAEAEGVFTVVVGGSESPRSSYVESVVGSSETESAAVDSAIGSPDSWLGGEALGGEAPGAATTPERLGESRSDVSLCDSGVAWDVGVGMHSGDAPEDEDDVVVTALGEGLGATTGKPQDRSLPELFIDEGVYSLSSMESTQDRIRECCERDDEDLGQNGPSKDVPGGSESEDKGGTDSERVDASPLGEDPVSNEKRASLDISEAPQQPDSGIGYSLGEPEGSNPGFGDKPLASDIGEEPERRGGVVANTDRESECAKETVEIGGGLRDNEGRSHVENESTEERESPVASETNTVRQRKESASEAEMEELLGVSTETNEGAAESVEGENETSRGVLNGHACLQENAGGGIIDTHAQIEEPIEDAASECPSANEGGGGASESHPDPGSSTRLADPRSVPRDDAPDQGDRPGREDQAGGEALEPTGSSGSRRGYETDTNGTERLGETSHDAGEQIHSKSIRCALCRNGGPTVAGMENGHFGDVVDPRNPDATDSFVSEAVGLKESQQKGDDDRASDIIIGDDDIAAPLPPGLESHDGLHPDWEATTTTEDRAADPLGPRGDTPPPSTGDPPQADRETVANGKADAVGDAVVVVDTFYLTNADRSSPLDELDHMDLFYPDNDNDDGGLAMFPEEEEESHGAPVFSVLALQRAPPSVTPPPDTPDSLRDAHGRRSPTDEATRRADGAPGEEGDFGRTPISSTQSLQTTGGAGRRELNEAAESEEDEEPWEEGEESLLDLRGGEVTAGGTDFKPLLLLGEFADLTPPPGPETEEGQSASCARANTEAMSSGAQSTSGVDDGLTCMVLRRRKGAASTEPKDNQRDASTSKVHSNGSELRRRGVAPEASNELYLLLLLWMLLYCAWLLPQMDLQALPSLLFNMEH